MASRVAASNGGMVNGVSKTPFLIGVAGGTASGKVRTKLATTTLRENVYGFMVYLVLCVFVVRLHVMTL